MSRDTTLTVRQFDALAALMRLSTDTPRGRALRSVLCDGVPVASAARADEGIGHPLKSSRRYALGLFLA